MSLLLEKNSMSILKVYKSQCANCLISKDRIVSPKRAKQLIEDTLKDEIHFICHKASMNDEDVCCKAYFEAFKSKNKKLQILQMLEDRAIEQGIQGVFIKEIELPDDERLPSYLDMKNEDF